MLAGEDGTTPLWVVAQRRLPPRRPTVYQAQVVPTVEELMYPALIGKYIEQALRQIGTYSNDEIDWATLTITLEPEQHWHRLTALACTKET